MLSLHGCFHIAMSQTLRAKCEQSTVFISRFVGCRRKAADIMLLEICAAAGALALLNAGHSTQSAARLVGRAAGRAAGSVRRMRAEVIRMQQRAQAAGGADLRDSSAELGRKIQQLRMVQQETSALLRMRPSTLFTADGRTIENNASEFSDEELYDAIKSEMLQGKGFRSAPSAVPTAGMRPPPTAAAASAEAPQVVQEGAHNKGRSPTLEAQAPVYHPPPHSSSGGPGLRGASLVSDLLAWEQQALVAQALLPRPAYGSKQP